MSSELFRRPDSRAGTGKYHAERLQQLCVGASWEGHNGPAITIAPELAADISFGKQGMARSHPRVADQSRDCHDVRDSSSCPHGAKGSTRYT
jgi:hypothetical protein